MSFNMSRDNKDDSAGQALDLVPVPVPVPCDTPAEIGQSHHRPITTAAQAIFNNPQSSVVALVHEPRPASNLANDSIFQEYHQQSDDTAAAHDSAHPGPPNMTANPHASARAAAFSSAGLDPAAAFHESVLDALADPDGAAFWRRVYGVDLSTLPRTRTDPATGARVRTTDAELVALARRRIFVAQHARARYTRDAAARVRRAEDARRRHVAAEQARARRRRRDEEQKEEEAAARRRRRAAARLEEEVERALRRADERRARARRADAWARYVARCAAWAPEQATIPWPTLSGGRGDLSERHVRAFLVAGLDLKAVGAKEFMARLKEQRVRWHPDKMQQKMGGKDKIEKDVMADITMVFQVIDTLYEDTRKTS